MNIKQCPECKRRNAQYSVLGPQARYENLEVWLAAYCPDCGYSWWIIYQPICIEDR